MGWSFGWSTKRELIRYLTSPTRIGNDVTMVTQCIRGNVLWSVCEFKQARGQIPAGKRFIGCDVLAGPSDGERDWGYKAMDETVHPFYYTCPLGYLDMVPEECAAWRAEVRAYHARCSQPLQVGQTVRLVNSAIPSVTITSLRPLVGRYNGCLYRIPRRMLAAPASPEEGAKAAELALTNVDG